MMITRILNMLQIFRKTKMADVVGKKESIDWDKFK